MSVSFVLVSLRGSTYGANVRFASSLTAALLDGLFEHPQAALRMAHYRGFSFPTAPLRFYRSLVKSRLAFSVVLCSICSRDSSGWIAASCLATCVT